MLVEGDAATALGDMGRERWERAGGGHMEPCLPQPETAWPKGLRAEFDNVEIGIARTVAPYNGEPEVREIEDLFVEHISRAKHFIYAESQYFASRAVAEALAERLSRPDPPEVVLINPLTADGWLEQTAMDGARVRLLHAVGEKDPNNRFRVFCPFTTGGTPIYVHAKVMIVDDEILRIGSANMNNRSMGLDTEADIFIDTARPANDRDEVRAAIRRLRHRLLAEHCGTEPAKVAELLETHGSMAAMIESLPRKAKRLEAFNLRPLTETEKALADSALLDPERPEELFEPIGRRRGLFRLGSLLRRPN
jgi:phosphatidylserine/phosphatidylglycerophosphate/cardiolipin synthase-like enzyme